MTQRGYRLHSPPHSIVREPAMRTVPRARAWPKRMTFEEFLEWPDEGAWAEWVNGKVVPMAPVRAVHQEIASFLIALLRHYVEAHDLGIVSSGPYVMKLSRSGREPDLVFVRRSRAKRLGETYLDGAADLVVEIVSPDSRTRDRRDKYAEYQEARVREYWIIDPFREQADFYTLARDHTFQPLPIKASIVRSKVLKGLWLDVTWFWQKPLPRLMTVLKAWKIV